MYLSLQRPLKGSEELGLHSSWRIGACVTLELVWSLCVFHTPTPSYLITLSMLSFPWPFKLLTMILFHFTYFCELLQYIVFGLVYRQGNQVHVAGGIKKAACFVRAFSLVKTKQRTITAITKITEAVTLFFPPWSWLWWDLIQQRWGGAGGGGAGGGERWKATVLFLCPLGWLCKTSLSGSDAAASLSPGKCITCWKCKFSSSILDLLTRLATICRAQGKMNMRGPKIKKMIRISRRWQQITKPNGCSFWVWGSAHEAGLADWKGTSGGRAFRALQVILMLGEVWEPQIANLPAFPQPTDVTVSYGSSESQIRRETTDSGRNLSPGWQRG